MEITAGMVKELRERTGSGMMDCKKARPKATETWKKPLSFLGKKAWLLQRRRLEELQLKVLWNLISMAEEESVFWSKSILKLILQQRTLNFVAL